MMLTIAELPEFIRIAAKLLSETERMEIVRYLAEHPKSGDLMEGTGGCVNYAGGAATTARAAASESFIIFMMSTCRSICSRFLQKGIVRT